MTPGQLNRWALNQWWKVRMLASWVHLRVLKPALSSTNGHWRRNRQLDSLRTLSAIPATLVEHGEEIDGHGSTVTASAGAVHESRAKLSCAIHW
jgi:hypothetical protein